MDVINKCGYKLPLRKLLILKLFIVAASVKVSLSGGLWRCLLARGTVLPPTHPQSLPSHAHTQYLWHLSCRAALRGIRPHRWRAQSAGLAHGRHQSWVAGHPQSQSNLATCWRAPTTPPRFGLFIGAALSTQGNTYPCSLKDMIKDADESWVKRCLGQGLGGSWAPGAFVPVERDCHCPCVDLLTHLEAFQTLYLWDFMETSSGRPDWLAPFPASLLERMGWWGGWKFAASHHGLVHLGTSPIQGPQGSPH